MMDEAVAVLRAQGATVIDPADIPSALAKNPRDNVLFKETCHFATDVRGGDDKCSVVLKYGFKRDFNVWLASLGDATPVKTIAELRAWNTAHAAAGTLKYGQTSLDISDEVDLAQDRARYDADRQREIRLAGAKGLDAVLKGKKLDAVIFAGSKGDSMVAKPGYPTVTVPFGMVANGGGYPAGFTPKPAPLGITFSGTACSEPRLLALAYAFEQATKRRRPPELTASR
jgi:amidase